MIDFQTAILQPPAALNYEDLTVCSANLHSAIVLFDIIQKSKNVQRESLSPSFDKLTDLIIDVIEAMGAPTAEKEKHEAMTAATALESLV